jgi:hypothetical protein
MDRTSRKNAGLIWKLYSMDKPSVSGLARQLAGTGEDCEDEFEAWRKQIHRALNDKDALRIVSDDSMTYLGYSILPGSLIQKRPGPGRPPGRQNKITVALKEAILAAGEAAGGAEGLTGYLTRLAVENSSAYAGLLAKVLPSTLAADANSDGGNVEIRFIRHIVYPNGHVEIEGVTPKALPAPPDASHVLPNSTEPIDDTNEGAV